MSQNETLVRGELFRGIFSAFCFISKGMKITSFDPYPKLDVSLSWFLTVYNRAALVNTGFCSNIVVAYIV